MRHTSLWLSVSWSRACCLALLGLGTCGCKQRHSVTTASSATASAATAVSAVPALAASAVAPSSASATPPKPMLTTHCKALVKGKLVAIGAHGGEASGLASAGGLVFAVAKQGARASVVQFSRDGAKPTELAHVMVSRSPESLCVDERAAYFTVGSTLYAAPLGGGEIQELAAAFSRPIALGSRSVYGVRCAPERKVDELVQLPREGGDLRVVGSWPRASGKTCDYHYVAVDGSHAFISDWTARRITAVSLTDGTLTELAVKRPFPQRIAVEATSVAFQSAGGIFRVKKQGAEVVQVSDYGSTPFESMTWDDSGFYVLHTLAYAPSDTLVRIPLAGGKPEQLEGFPVADVTMGGGRVDVAVDDECVYIAHNGADYVEVLARPKPR